MMGSVRFAHLIEVIDLHLSEVVRDALLLGKNSFENDII